MNVLFLAAASSQPSWLWYATRGLGVTVLIVLTATVVLGVATAVRWSGQDTPGFVAPELHRNLSLVASVLLVAHVATSVLDPFAQITVRDAVIPVGATYRPIWLGLGVLSMDILVAVIVTSLLRHRIGPRLWKVIHWVAYASWPMAVVHTLGTGSDVRSPWLIALVAACVAAVLLAVQNRLRHGSLATLPIRALGSVTAAGAALVIGVWAFGGPLQADWSARAGTPPAKKVAGPALVHPGPEGFSDPLVGVLVRGPGGSTQVSMRDTVDTPLTIAVRSADPNAEKLPVITVARDGRVLCTSPAAAGDTLYAVCGKTRLDITIYGTPAVQQAGGQVTGKLDASGPLN